MQSVVPKLFHSTRQTGVSCRGCASARIRIAFFLLLLFVFAAQCSSVERVSVEPASLDPSPPVIRPRLISARQAATEDYKLRQQATKQIRLGVYDASPKGTDPALRRVLASQLRSLLGAAGVAYTPFPQAFYETLASKEQWNERHKARYAFCKKRQLDGILVFSFVPEKSKGPASQQTSVRGALVLELYDPVFASKYQPRRYEVRLHASAIDPKHQAELAYRRGSYLFLSSMQSAAPELRGVSVGDFRRFVRRTVTGNLQITATSPGVRVLLRQAGRLQKKLRPPFSPLLLPEGRYELVAYRKGYPIQKREVFIRAGRPALVFFRYPDDRSNASVAILSSPPGQRVALDNRVVGETPYYATSLEPGAYELELSRKEGDSWFRTATGKIETQPGEPLTRALFTSYRTQFGLSLASEGFFELSAEKGMPRLSDGPGLGLVLKGAPKSSYLGLISRPLLVADFAAVLEVEETPDRTIRFGLVGGASGSKQPALFVHLENGSYSVLIYRDGKLIEPKESWKTRKKEGSKHLLRIEYDARQSEVTLRIDGSRIFEAKMPELFTGGTARLSILTRASQADGRILAHGFRMFTGPGLSEEDQ